jgi:hypothetical protein
MYGQIETINQLINAYLRITFSEWCWVFMDGIWTITLAFTLPLARSATTLAQTLPTASVLGPQTLSSVLGILVIHFIFLVGALSYLWHQDWFQVSVKCEGQLALQMYRADIPHLLFSTMTVPQMGWSRCLQRPNNR